MTIPPEYLIPNDEHGLQTLIDFIYDEETLKNPTAYLSTDEAIPVGKDGAATEMLYPPEYLNTLKFPGLPPNTLHLKIGTPIMLLRNVNLGGGLCEGTITALNTSLEWYYKSCNSCSIKLTNDAGIYNCRVHGPVSSPTNR